jgi:mono/diheme cytochrome c family protein
LAVLLALLLQPANASRAAEAPQPPEPPSFARDIAPTFARWCVGCHGPREQQASLRLDSYEAVLAGGDSGPPVLAGDPAASLLVAKIERRDRPAMPPRKRLPKAAVTAIRAWIGAGAQP